MADNDAIVIGGSFAGLAAASWLARYRRSVLVIDAGEPRNRWSDAAHGYLGNDPIAPMELLKKGREELFAYPAVELCEARAESVTREDDRFVVRLGRDEVTARRVVLATGIADEFPDVKGFFDHYGASVFHCASCDGYEAKGKRVVSFGWSEQVAGFALKLLNWAAEVTVVTDGRHFEGEDEHLEALRRGGISLLEDEALELSGQRGDLEAVRLRGGGGIECDLAFFTIAHHYVNDLAVQLGCELTDEGSVKVNDEGATSVSGVYAAGDLTPGNQLVAVAVAKGVNAGIACAHSLG